MIKIDLRIKKNDKIPTKLTMERNPYNNKFFLLGTNFFKLFELTIDNKINELKVGYQRRINLAIWGKSLKNTLYFYDSCNALFLLNLDSNSKNTRKYHKLKELSNELFKISINCNDSILALCNRNNNIDLLDLQKNQIISTICKKNLVLIRDCQFSPFNENYLLISGDAGNIYFYNIVNCSSPIKNFDSEPKDILSVAWHPTKKNIFCSGGMDNYIRIWDINYSDKPLAEFKTSEGCAKVCFLKPNPNYIISSYQTNNYNINLWNIKFRDIPEYRYTGNDYNIIGFDIDYEGTRIFSIDKKGILIINYLNKGERILDDITTNIIKFNNNNELYCFHDDKIQKENLSEINLKDSNDNEKVKNDNNKAIIMKQTEENISNIYMLNFNQKEMQIKQKTISKGDIKLHLKKNIKIKLNNELRQYYVFTPEQIHSIFKGYIYYIEKNENLYKRKRFQSWNAINTENMSENSNSVDKLDFSEKLELSIRKNFLFAKKHLINYNHISIWNTLLNLSEKNTFKSMYNKFMGKEPKIANNKKRKKTIPSALLFNSVNKSFEKENENYEMNHPSSLKLMTTLVINQLSKIVDYLIDDYGDIYLATIICYLFKPILFKDENLKKRILRLIKDCVNNLRKYQLYVAANHLVKYGPEENNNIDGKTFIFNYSCTECQLNKFENGRCSCGKIISCEECEKKISGLLLWCPSCGHEEHLSHINKNKTEYYCIRCKKKKKVDN